MGREITYRSDLTGNVIEGDEPKPYTLTIKAPGQTAKDAFDQEIFLTEEDFETIKTALGSGSSLQDELSGGLRAKVDKLQERVTASDSEIERLQSELELQRVTRKGRSSGSSTKSDPEQLKKIREWATANGHEVSDRGRIKQEIQDAYQAAMSKNGETPAFSSE